MAARVPVFPDARSDLLNSAIVAFRKRSKGIRNSLRSWTIQLSIDGDQERIDFDFDAFGPQIRLSMWGDGAIWFRACQGGNAGWDYMYAFDARQDLRPSTEIAEALKKSLACVSDKSSVMTIWKSFDPQEDKRTTI